MNVNVIGYFSDSHLEFRDAKFIDEVVTFINGHKHLDMLLIGGDIHSDSKKRKKFLERITIPFKHVMGNHDYFKTEVYDDSFDEDGIVGACLWTNFNNNPNDSWYASRRIWDFKYIPEWTTAKCAEMNRAHVDKIFASSSEIVLTHFTPSFQCIADKHKGDPLNSYFNNNLDKMIYGSNKKFWICGHSHVDMDFMIGDCRILANQWGYPNELNKPLEIKTFTIPV